MSRLPVAAVWLRRNLFAGVWSTLLTVAMVALLAFALPPLVRWGVTNAVLWGQSRAVCPENGACWAVITARFPFFVYGSYPVPERWRPTLVFVLFLVFAVPAFRERIASRTRWVLLLVTLFPLVAGILLWGGVPGLPFVDTSQWGGLMVNCVLAYVAVAGSLPIGIMLALGRRSRLPVVRNFSVAFIELWRGVPLLTVLFMSAVMLPLFLPHGVSIDRLIRAMAVFTLFNSAYMAETVRGGLQGVPAGQEEAAASLGLGWWQMQLFVALPQALRIVVPGIVNNIVDLFKDTSLVTIISLVDLLGAVEQALKDPAWLGFAKEGYIFTAAVFFLCCFAMSSYGRRFERRLNRHRTGRA